MKHSNNSEDLNAYEARQLARRERLLRIASKLESEGNSRYLRAKQMAEAIPFGQPILVGHHSEGRDRRYRARIHTTYGKAFAAMDQAKAMRAKADAVGTGGISSDDPDAISKLREELANCEKSQEQMKAANAAIRKNAKGGREAQIAALVQLGFSETIAAKAIQPDFCGRIGFPDYALKNNNANARRIKGRIAELEQRAKVRDALKAEGVASKTEERAGYQLVENYDANRLQLFFPGKPSEAVRTLLKQNGFRWSPTEGAWQCFLNSMGAYHAREGYMRQKLEHLLAGAQS